MADSDVLVFVDGLILGLFDESLPELNQCLNETVDI
jgi:hypothetical protein